MVELNCLILMLKCFNCFDLKFFFHIFHSFFPKDLKNKLK